jgi:hypothetical protein
VQAPRRKAVRHQAAAAAPGRSAYPNTLHHQHHTTKRRRWPARALGRFGAPAHLPFWLAGALAVESFRLAHIVATEPARSSGMLGLLLAFFVALPAATLRRWAPRTTVLLWALAALAYGGLAAKAGLAQWAVASAGCALAAGAPLLLRARRAPRLRPAGRNAPHAQVQASDRHPPEAA